MTSPSTLGRAALAAPEADDQRPTWKRNIGGIVGAVGYYDSRGEIIIVTNWASLLHQQRNKINVSEPGYGMELVLSDEGIAYWP